MKQNYITCGLDEKDTNAPKRIGFVKKLQQRNGMLSGRTKTA